MIKSQITLLIIFVVKLVPKSRKKYANNSEKRDLA